MFADTFRSGFVCPPRAGLVAALLALAAPLGVAGCSDALVYGERTGFNMSLSVDPTRSLPLEANAGLRRSVVSFIPAQGGAPEDDDGRPQASGQAVNMVSAFDLRYDDDASVFGGSLIIRSSFAAGDAAIALTKPPSQEEAPARALAAPAPAGAGTASANDREATLTSVQRVFDLGHSNR
ncbi:MAG: hypothetical protein GVY09_08295 [Gammaproteobacteria bacterium]|jgi:hypothetical protein|nr:hypothetical protein [Gammaproteobacteria bacterium]